MTTNSPELVQSKRLLIFANEPPLPASHGARIDIWSRYAALRSAGWNLGLVYWEKSSAETTDDTVVKLRSVFDLVKIFYLPKGIRDNFQRLLRMYRMPSFAAARHLGNEQFLLLAREARNFKPSAIISESISVAPVAMRMARELGAPLFIRSHNIEHRYMRTQLRLAKGFRARLSILPSLIGLGRFENCMMRQAACVLDISRDDAEFWRGKGMRDVVWSPSIFPELDHAPPVTIPYFERPYDVGYLGNLWAPNNVAALTWFINEVHPLLVKAKPDIKIFIAGSGPSLEIKTIISQTANIDLLENPHSASETRALARVLINPILEGSGLNTKSVELLYCDSPLVVTPFALGGMEAETAETYVIESTASAFAEGIISQIEIPFKLSLARRKARHRFGRGGLLDLDSLLCARIAPTQSGR